jgi:hypothetical protein
LLTSEGRKPERADKRRPQAGACCDDRREEH